MKNKKKFKKTVSAYGANLLVTHLWATASKFISNLTPLGLSLVQNLKKIFHSLFFCRLQNLKNDVAPWFSFYWRLVSALLLKCTSKCSSVNFDECWSGIPKCLGTWKWEFFLSFFVEKPDFITEDVTEENKPLKIKEKNKALSSFIQVFNNSRTISALWGGWHFTLLCYPIQWKGNGLVLLPSFIADLPMVPCPDTQRVNEWCHFNGFLKCVT